MSPPAAAIPSDAPPRCGRSGSRRLTLLSLILSRTVRVRAASCASGRVPLNYASPQNIYARPQNDARASPNHARITHGKPGRPNNSVKKRRRSRAHGAHRGRRRAAAFCDNHVRGPSAAPSDAFHADMMDAESGGGGDVKRIARSGGDHAGMAVAWKARQAEPAGEPPPHRPFCCWRPASPHTNAAQRCEFYVQRQGMGCT